jgi:hypothetical protein
MIWLTWRQHRKQLLYSVIGLAVLAAFIYPTGRAMRSDFARLGLAACAFTTPGPGNNTCETASRQFTDQWSPLTLVGLLFLILPLLVGLFWGAPLIAREVEHGTHRLVWTQGVSRRQWALVKFAFVGGFAVLASVAYGLGMSWWLTPLSQSGQMNRFQPLIFDMQGVVPIGYTLFGVALGIFGGTLWPRMLPAMGTTLAGFLGVRLAVELLAPAALPGTGRPDRPARQQHPDQRRRRLGTERRHQERRRPAGTPPRPHRVPGGSRRPYQRRTGVRLRTGPRPRCLQLGAGPASRSLLDLPVDRDGRVRGARAGTALPGLPQGTAHRLVIRPNQPVGYGEVLWASGASATWSSSARQVPRPDHGLCRGAHPLVPPGGSLRRARAGMEHVGLLL